MIHILHYIALRLGAFLEYSINKVDENIKVDLNLNLLKIINDGYMPCGWSFKSEDIIDFSERSFDYSAGYLIHLLSISHNNLTPNFLNSCSCMKFYLMQQP